jgi:trans-aconitate 2-methyltransferase
MSQLPGSREWDAAEYQRLSSPQFRWGTRVLSQLDLRGDERVLDAGCGTGKLTRVLLENLPRGRVVALDLSTNMVRHAQTSLRPQFGDRIAFVAADLSALPFTATFDGIVSTASFHWVLDHDKLFANLFAALRRGGWLHAQCGGGPNLSRLRQRVHELAGTPEFSPWLADFAEPWFYSDAEGASQRLRKAGFVDVVTNVEAAPATLSSREEFQDFVRSIVLHRHLERLPDDSLRQSLLQQLAALSAQDEPPWTLDYWRLNLHARKPG